jgi:hypothetical protein
MSATRTKPSSDSEPPMPRNDSAERAVLGAILQDDHAPNQTLAKACEKINTGDFYDSRHQIVFSAMCRMSGQIDIITLSDFLQGKGRLEDAGGAAYISGLDKGTPTYLNPDHLRILKQASQFRQLAHTGLLIRNSALDQEEDARDLIDRARLSLAALAADVTVSKIRAVTATEVTNMDVRAKSFLVDGLLETNTINEVFARKGVGKTWFTLTVANAIATGGDCLKWKSSRARKVGYLDGELDQTQRKERFALLGITGENLEILSTDTLDCPFPSLATPAGQRMVEDAFSPDIEALFIDNLAALAPSSQDKESAEWVIIQTWLHDLKRRGISTVFNHHAGHAGWARGTTRREDLCSTVIKLHHPENYSPAERCRFELSFDKNRPGVDASPIECVLTTDADGLGVWTWRDCEDVRAKQVKELRASGLSLRDIVKETGIPYSTVNRLAKKGM